MEHFREFRCHRSTYKIAIRRETVEEESSWLYKENRDHIYLPLGKFTSELFTCIDPNVIGFGWDRAEVFLKPKKYVNLSQLIIKDD